MISNKTNKDEPSGTNVESGDLEQLLELYGDDLAGKVWRGFATRQQQQHASTTLASGYAELDKLLSRGGWPLNTTTELGLAQPGIGEFRLLTPALRELQNKQHGSIIMVAPPLLPFAPALIKEQLDTSRLTVVQTNTLTDTLWATEQALLSECCAAVISWVGNAPLDNRQLRRLQLAAEQSHTWNVLFRDSERLKQASASGLRIHLKTNTYSQLEINIIKQPQGWGGQQCTLSLHPHYEQWQRLPAHLLPQHNRSQTPDIPVELNSYINLDQQQASVTILSPLSALQAVH